MALGQILVHKWGPENGFWHCFTDGLNQEVNFCLLRRLRSEKLEDESRKTTEICLFTGIGVDDMFVIVQAWNNLPLDFVKNRGVPEAIGVALQHAVSSIPGRFSNKYILACFGTYTALSFTSDSVNTALGIIRVMDIL